MGFDRHEILVKHYKETLANVNWDAVIKDAKENVIVTDDEQLEGRSFIGSVFRIMPSGKYYTPWTSNQSRSDMIRDAAYWDALESLADKHGCYISPGEGDPCDLFVCLGVEYDDVIQFVTSDDAELAQKLNAEE